MIDWPAEQIPLTAAGLLLRPLVAADAAALHSYLQDPDCVQFTTIQLPFDLADAKARIERSIQGFAAHSIIEYAITDAGGDLQGTAVLYNFREFDHVCEIGYSLAPAGRGRGLATRAVSRLTDYAFELGVRRVHAMVDPANASSIKVMQRAGFELEVAMRQALTRRDGTQAAGLLYSKVVD